MGKEPVLPVLLLGASRGVGAALAALLDESEVPAVAIARSRCAAKESVCCDLYSSEGRAELKRYVEGRFPAGISALVYTLGTYASDSDADDRDNQQLWDTHVLCLDRLISDHADALKHGAAGRSRGAAENRAGTTSIVVVSSADAFRAGTVGRHPLYAAAKAAQVSFLRRMAIRLAPHVRVNCVAAGFVRSTFTQQQLRYESDPEFRSAIDAKVPLGTAGRCVDVAHACHFLIDPCRSGWITGSTLIVDGGASA